MKRQDFFKEPVEHIRIRDSMSVDQLVQEFGRSGSFGAGRLATACDIYENMIKSKKNIDCRIINGTEIGTECLG